MIVSDVMREMFGRMNRKTKYFQVLIPSFHYILWLLTDILCEWSEALQALYPRKENYSYLKIERFTSQHNGRSRIYFDSTHAAVQSMYYAALVIIDFFLPETRPSLTVWQRFRICPVYSTKSSSTVDLLINTINLREIPVHNRRSNINRARF